VVIERRLGTFDAQGMFTATDAGLVELSREFSAMVCGRGYIGVWINQPPFAGPKPVFATYTPVDGWYEANVLCPTNPSPVFGRQNNECVNLACHEDNGGINPICFTNAGC
jgi:hypothetical protein